MPQVTYTGPAGRRVLLERDGFSTDLHFQSGVPTDVSGEDADLIAGGPHRNEFQFPDLPADAGDDAQASTDDQPPAPKAGRTQGKAS